ncbi:glycoside hydrolase [Streptomyces cinereoruber]|uniref:Glycoside hydrolase n=1 Tax=Streptomyces cinereoruber TaxID=67260 RepID=A0AAV4KE04_9ACTN|nr:MULTISPECIES: C40 family peptidase [Streptomyces]AVH96067.1 NlpC/P60 family protein [Streptomyces sp. WAC00288]KYG54728.1 glycoside hydrolase [Streptomyces sp. WAC04657]MBB4156933.1 cell wall-associated NlpC family hydrolase [Streptomyces cinereoruber]MBY8815247.1 C40 family peptidase [Streptomyces cinereoruber]NIH59969.1 cell wall-associated NlpC family hydrolase [Streptomyces cinereoruber]
MSHTAHIPSHRKPRRSASKLALRAGVAGGVLGTIAVAGAAGPANAEPVTETIEMPTLGSLDAGTNLASAVAAAAEASQQEALDQNLQSLEQVAFQKASQEAKKAKAEADRKAAAERAEKARLKAEKERKEAEEAAERASRADARTQLTTNSSSNDGGSSSSSSDSGAGASDSDSRTQAPTGSAASIVAFARAQVGDSYVTGGTGPNSWDCSGLVQAAYRAAGIDLPRISYQQSSMGSSVSLSNLQPGDILYWGSRSGSYHVAIYVGGGKYVGAQNSSTGVVERSLDWDPPSGAVRIL